MLASKQLKAFVPTVNPQQGKPVYKDISGLTVLSEDNYALEFESNGILCRVIIVPELKSQLFTVSGWNVDNISSLVKSLNNKAIFCKYYPFLQHDHLGIWTSANGSIVPGLHILTEIYFP
jgi:hypothetical protein